MKKHYINHDQLTQASEKLREELVEFCKENNIYTWKQTKGQMERVEPDEYNLPLFNYGQLLAFLLPKLIAFHVENNKENDGVITTVWFKEEKYGMVGNELILGAPALALEPIDSLWGIILHYGTEIDVKSS